MKVGAIASLECGHQVLGLDEHQHGHSYLVEAVVEGVLKNGMVIDFHDLKDKLKKCLEKYQTKNLNAILEVPTSENLARDIFVNLEKNLPGLVMIRLKQGQDISIEITHQDI
jgi:6-pyruvoyl-tetrahydropterin synthase